MKRLLPTTLALPLLLACAEEPGPPRDVVQVETALMVPMRDGVRLATDVFRPDSGDEPLPALLHRTPYDRTSPRLAEQARWFASMGYVVALQDMRGLYGSEGVFHKYHEFDAPDGYDTVEWLAALDYTEARVGMWGTSYGAHTQADAAKLAPPSLATLVLNMGGLSDPWTHKIRNHGAFELGQQLGWAHSQLSAVIESDEARRRLEATSPADWFPLTPFVVDGSPLAVAPNFEAYYLEMQNNGDYDAYFRGIGRNWVEYYDQTSDIPMLHVGGWYDSYAPGTIQSFAELSRRKSAPMRLVMGPWTHGQNTRSRAGDIELGPTAAVPDFPREFHLRWFDHHLKGQGNGDPFPAATGAVTVFVMGGGDGRRTGDGALFHGGSWRSFETWPPERATSTPFHLREGGGLSPDPPSADEGASRFTYDPTDPVPTIGGAFSGALKRGGYDQRERTFVSLSGGSQNGFFGSTMDGRRTAERPDVLVFETEPLETDLVIVGPVTARLFVSSSAPDTDFTAKLVDVYPPSEHFPEGFDLNITDGILRARYRDSRESESPAMEPGASYEIEVRLFPTANRFQAGHRIRLEISSSNYPRFDPNPNTGEPLGRHTQSVIADNTIHHDADRPSALVLSVLAEHPEAR